VKLTLKIMIGDEALLQYQIFRKFEEAPFNGGNADPKRSLPVAAEARSAGRSGQSSNWALSTIGPA